MSPLHNKPAAAIAVCLTGLLIAGCTPNETTTELRELRADMERLQNEIGRLEFRIYELENPVPSPQTRGTWPAPAEPNATDPAVAEPLPDGHFDLRPPG